MAAAWRAILVVNTLIVLVSRLLSLWLWRLLLRVGWRVRAPFSLLVGDGMTGIRLGWIGMSGRTLVIKGL
jgi:hypothetical protein